LRGINVSHEAHEIVFGNCPILRLKHLCWARDKMRSTIDSLKPVITLNKSQNFIDVLDFFLCASIVVVILSKFLGITKPMRRLEESRV
jgi:hypothetical protein